MLTLSMHHEQLDENQLVQQILQGNIKFAHAFYHRFQASVSRYVVSRTKCKEDAEEIVQDVFLSAIESLPLYSGKGKLISWIYGIAKHEIFDYYRKKRVKTLIISHVPVLKEILGDENWKTQYEAIAIREQIKLVMQKILPRYATLLKMKYLEGWSVEEMANKLNETLKATENALLRARKAFALEWAKDYSS